MKLIVDITDAGNIVTAVGNDHKPVIICESVKRMASQLVRLSEIYSGEEVDSVYFADVAYLSRQEESS